MSVLHPAGRSTATRPGARRRGITLIEVIVLMTAVAAMLGLGVLMLQLLMRLDADSRSRLDSSATLARLGRQFRLDVHRAREARLLPQAAAKKPPVLRIEPSPKRAIEYQVQGEDKVVRVETKEAAVVGRETYLVPRSGAIRLELNEQDGRRFVVLTVDRLASKNRTDPTRRFEVLALLGKNRDRVSTQTEGKVRGGKP
jgi:hypothetical protein